MFTFASHPVELRPSQLSKPVSHVPTVQRPDAHVGAVLCASMQTLPHMPQLFGSLVRSPQPEPVSAVALGPVSVVAAASVVLAGPESCDVIVPL